MMRLSDEWAPFLSMHPETGMGYWICTVGLKDGRSFERVLIDSGYIVRCDGSDEIPFAGADLDWIKVTHDKTGLERRT